MLSPVTWPHWSGVPIEGVARLLRDLPISATEYAFGRRKLFIKSSHTVIRVALFIAHAISPRDVPLQVAQLEDLRHLRMEELAIQIQTAFRSWAMRMHFLRMRDAQVKIANAWRRYKVHTGVVFVFLVLGESFSVTTSKRKS